MSSPSAHEVLSKFEFYFLALTFTLLGISIQTADLSEIPNLAKSLEVGAWLLLVVSGFVGLSKLQWISSIVMARDKKDYYRQMTEVLNKSKASGQTHAFDPGTGKQVPIPEVLDMVKKNESDLGNIISQLGSKHETKHHIQWWTFHAAIALFIGGRIIAAFC